MGERFPTAWTIGNARLGVGGTPSPRHTTPELCPGFFHPPATYNPWVDRTWCLCGRKIYRGNHATLIACGSGALTEANPEYVAWEQDNKEVIS